MSARIWLVVASACILACSAGVTPSTPSFAADPDTEPLAPAPKPRIPDPRSPIASSAPPAAEAKDPKPDAKPDVKPVMTASSEPSAKPTAKPPVKSPPAATPAVADCGSKDNPCPMQKLMRGMGAASTPEALEAAFSRVATLSPNAGWQWSAIAKKGAELAKGGDTATAKRQCKVCHDQYRDAYKAQYRGRKL